MNRYRRAGRSRGQALAEFALVIPILVLLMLALFDMGRAVFVYNGLTNAAREGSRLAIVNQDTVMVGERVENATFGGAVTNLSDGTLVRYFRSQPNADVTTNPTCTPIAVGCVAVVTPKTTWSLITPVLSSIIGPMDLEARSELPIELVCPGPSYAAPEDCPRQP
jgi:Flp pilus assembly protein TadG